MFAKGNTKGFKKGCQAWNKGIKGTSWGRHTQEHRNRMKIVMLGKNLGRKRPQEEIDKIRKNHPRGADHPQWRGGITPKHEILRRGWQNREWREHVFSRDDFTCQACGKRGGNLHADHELPFSAFPALRFEILNGRTLCIPCHRKTETYGRKALTFWEEPFARMFDS